MKLKTANYLNFINLNHIKNGIAVPLLLLAMLSMMILPLPKLVLDILFTFNIMLALMMLLTCLYALRPLDFSAFPTMLLLATLLRLTLNIASVRVVLLHGQEGANSAGNVIKAFGEVVVGGNYVVGMVVFTILMIINFVVVTKGAGRISEVSARFTLDAMPGKQMAIDADLNAGLINQDEAKSRRAEVSTEADFYGAMDGASKFVRGDALAGLLIMAVTLIGGFGVGVLQHGLSVSEAAKIYALLTIGDGLAAQIPALLLSIAAAVMVTRVSKEADISSQISQQMLANPKALIVSSIILTVMGLIPGMPHLVFLLLACLAGFASIMLSKKSVVTSKKLPEPKTDTQTSNEPSWSEVNDVDLLGIELGFRLIDLVDETKNAPLLKRIRAVRSELSKQLGFVLPKIHIRDNLDLAPNDYSVLLTGNNIGTNTIYPDKILALNSNAVSAEINGIKVIEPAFNLEAVWIEQDQNIEAESLGYGLIDASSVLATHIHQLLKLHAHELLGIEEVNSILEVLAQNQPKLAEQLVPNAISLPNLMLLLRALLKEQVAIKDMRTIALTICASDKNMNWQQLLVSIRIALGRQIIQSLIGVANTVKVLGLGDQLTEILLNSAQNNLLLEPGLAADLVKMLNETTQKLLNQNLTPILLVMDNLRPSLAQFVHINCPNLHVLALSEIPNNMQVKVISEVG